MNQKPDPVDSQQQSDEEFAKNFTNASQQDIYSVPIPKSARETNAHSATIQGPPDLGSYGIDTYNHLNTVGAANHHTEEPNNYYDKLDKNDNTYDHANTSAISFPSTTGDTYSHLNIDNKNTFETETKTHGNVGVVMKTIQDSTGNDYSATQSDKTTDADTHYIYNHIQASGQPILETVVYGYSSNDVKPCMNKPINSDYLVDGDVPNNTEEENDETYYNLSDQKKSY